MLQKQVINSVFKFSFLVLGFLIIEPIFGQYCSVVINKNENKKEENCNTITDRSTLSSQSPKEVEVKVYTIAEDEESDGYKRFIYSAGYFGVEIHNLAHKVANDENDLLLSNGTYRIKLLKEALHPLKDNANAIVVFITDSYNTIFTAGLDEIIKEFITTNVNILFGTESYYNLQYRSTKLYSEVDIEILEDKLLSSKFFIGFAPSVYRMLEENPLNTADDEQVHYTKIFVNEDLRNEYRIELDTKSQIFQSLNEQMNDIKFNVDNKTLQGELLNIKYNTKPSIIYGAGSSRIHLNSFANYLGGTFKDSKCLICEKNLITYSENSLPIVSVAIFIEKAVPFFEEFLEGITTINYPKDRLNLFIHNNIPYHDDNVKEFAKKSKGQYKSVKLITTCNEIDEVDAKKLSVSDALRKKSDFLFSIDAEVRIDDSNILRDLLKYNRNFIAPVLTLKGYNYSNFWGALSSSGYYARSHDYIDIVQWRVKGMWNVPFVALCYLVHKSVFTKMNFDHMKLDPDMALSESLRNQGVFMNVINIKEYGHLLDNDEFDTTLTQPDFYMLISNKADWEKRYIHPDYHKQLKPHFNHTQPCPDVYWFAVTTERFCKDLVNIMETFGKWSDGSNNDPRIEGGYEAVPTRDIHMIQVGLQEMWLRFLRDYVKPLKDIVYQDNDSSPPKTDMNFVVRYRPDEQASLMPHFDSSTYTINIALNRVGIDYQGGGCRFVRYNCSVTDTKMGWMLMHPGRLTHLHEGLTVINGTRYIMVSFIDP